MHHAPPSATLILLVLVFLASRAAAAAMIMAAAPRPAAAHLLHTRTAGWRHAATAATSSGASGAGPGSSRRRRLLFSQQRLRHSMVTSMTAQQHPRLDLVFDINKTILLEDPAGGKGVRALLNEVVSELAWGRVVAGGVPRWVSAELCVVDWHGIGFFPLFS
jgi:hypothetical protein